ncbi:hypothetical protein, unlikely [Trypanosoma brucei gambiense DAL972]|uniref:Uncharacterized protein n=1 Tax=Trypanosoma brucei gambiense (strain MHOM/CI/86/DAL972) TaxID=679716 RepID=C9ZRM7_TRYB9|nr:hypothetical protein, unlikely [Trypanosoma brucei gambiense DAL972]CBH12329.1 hypothetical protein, unlikely [Trypanosoma brucei gambiense DAL972]|eukprot:XP_011774610.1 hypothetical protein, unlikely [Trypanosoma brucei gambiense DAL972]
MTPFLPSMNNQHPCAEVSCPIKLVSYYSALTLIFLSHFPTSLSTPMVLLPIYSSLIDTQHTESAEYKQIKKNVLSTTLFCGQTNLNPRDDAETTTRPHTAAQCIICRMMLA